MKRLLSFVVGLALASASVTGPVAAQTAGGEITVVVTDAATHAPIPGARVVLVGPAFHITVSDATGTVHLGPLPGGAYRVRVTRTGYDAKVNADIDVSPGSPSTVAVALAAAGPKVIGSVSTRSAPSSGATDVAKDGAAGRLAGSLPDALDKIAGVSVNAESNDADAPQTVSLRGHQDTQTGVAVDGVPVSMPGTALDLRSLGTDLFGSARVSFEPTAGSLGGTVNFRTLDPTPTLVERLTAQYGTYDRGSYGIGISDTVGRVGVAAMHSWRGGNSPLTFQSFLDRSGIGPYDHGGESSMLGDAVKLSYNIGPRTTIKAAAITSNSSAAALCTAWTAATPCGIGPDNMTFGRTSFTYATIESLVGNVSTALTAFGTRATQNSAELNRYVIGSPDPFTSLTQSGTNGFNARAAAVAGRSTYSLTATTYRTTLRDTPSTALATSSSANATTVALADEFRAGDRLSLRGHIGIANATSLGTALLSGFGATWRPTRSDSFDASATFGSSEPQLGSVRNVSDPVTAKIDCAAGTAGVNGPGDPPGKQSAIDYAGSWTHTGRLATFTVDAYHQTQVGQLIKTAVSEPAAYFPAAFLGDLANVWQSPLVCGKTKPFPNGVFATQLVGGTARLYEGIDASARVTLGRYAIAYPTASLTVAKLIGTSARLATLESPFVLGAQLPGVPVFRAGVTFAGVVPHGGLEWLLGGNYTAGNNARHLGPYFVTSAGIAHRFGPGRLTLTVNNLFNTDAGTFATELYSQPFRTSAGRLLATAAAPLLPRTYGLTYSFNVGAPPPPSALGEMAGRAPARLRQPGSGASRFLGFPDAGPAPGGSDALALAPGRRSCDPRMQQIVRPLLDVIRGYAADLAANRPLTQDARIAGIAHPGSAASTAWLELRPATATMADFGSCAFITVLAHHAAREHGIATPATGLGYASTLGIFFVRPPHSP